MIKINWGWADGTIEEQLTKSGVTFDKQKVKRIDVLNESASRLWIGDYLTNNQLDKIRGKLLKELKEAIDV